MFPVLLAQLHQLDFDYADGEGIDFEPYETFLDNDETKEWFVAWTGNMEADASRFKVFGQDGTGGLAAFWLIQANKTLVEQPIVFLGSEGQLGVVAKDFNEYLWLLASSHGPCEAVENPDDDKPQNPVFLAFAKEHSKSSWRKVSVILEEAAASYPDFTSWVVSQCR